MNDNKDTRLPNCVDSLPPEIIREILVLGLRATRKPQSRLKYLKAVSSVSKFWRSLAIGEAQLWSMVSIVLGNAVGTLRGAVSRGVEMGEGKVDLGSDEAELKRAAVWLRMSKNAPLHLTLDFYGTHTAVQHYVKELVMPHLHRCRTLRLRMYQPDPDPLVTRIWLPLPDACISLENIYLHLRIEPLDDGQTIDLGPPLTLRRLSLHSSPKRVFHSTFKVTDELEIGHLKAESILNILEHCDALKSLNIATSPHSLPAALDPPSLPSLDSLSMDELQPLLIAGAPNLRYLKIGKAGIASNSRWSPDSLENLARIEVLEIWNADHLGLGDGCLVRSNNVKVIRLNSFLNRHGFLRSLIPSAATFPPPPRTEQYTAQHAPRLTFPGLKLVLLQRDVRSPTEHLSIVRNLLQARPSLRLACDLGKVINDRFRNLADPMPEQFILIENLQSIPTKELVERYVR